MTTATSAPTASSDLVEIIPVSTVVPVEMSMSFCLRIQSAVGFFILGKSKQDLEAVHKQIETGTTVRDTWGQHYETLLILCKEFEKKAREMGKTQQVTPEEAMRLLGETPRT